MVNRGARFAERAGVEDVRVIGWEYSPRQGSAEIVADLCHPEKSVPHDSQCDKVFLAATLAPGAAPCKISAMVNWLRGCEVVAKGIGVAATPPAGREKFVDQDTTDDRRAASRNYLLVQARHP